MIAGVVDSNYRRDAPVLYLQEVRDLEMVNAPFRSGIVEGDRGWVSIMKKAVFGNYQGDLVLHCSSFRARARRAPPPASIQFSERIPAKRMFRSHIS